VTFAAAMGVAFDDPDALLSGGGGGGEADAEEDLSGSIFALPREEARGEGAGGNSVWGSFM
jgi:hypothetical protein